MLTGRSFQATLLNVLRNGQGDELSDGNGPLDVVLQDIQRNGKTSELAD